ncbi:MAG TPA: GFA family protein [Burkholderiales bacterium]|nr:GFA family protein [Burkholderiales bacterium]
MSERTGGCLCGQVRYRLTAEPVTSRICWCRDCQRIAGNGTVNALFPSQSIEITGSPSEYVREADSSHVVRRRFCPQCGCHLFAVSSGYPGVVVVRVGTLDDPSSIRPLANIWSSSAPGWACLDPSLKRVEKQPSPPREPAESK